VTGRRAGGGVLIAVWIQQGSECARDLARSVVVLVLDFVAHQVVMTPQARNLDSTSKSNRNHQTFKYKIEQEREIERETHTCKRVILMISSRLYLCCRA